MAVARLLNAPWKVRNEVGRLLLLPLARLFFAVKQVRWQRGWRVYGLPVVQRFRGSQIEIGPHAQMRSWIGSNPLAPNHRCVIATRAANSKLTIGHHIGMTGATIVCENEIRIGNHVRLGANSTVVDTDFHPLSVEERAHNPLGGRTRPVVIEDNVFVGMSAIILKGSHIGEGAVVGAGSVVSGHVPPRSIVAGNPAVVIKQID